MAKQNHARLRKQWSAEGVLDVDGNEIKATEPGTPKYENKIFENGVGIDHAEITKSKATEIQAVLGDAATTTKAILDRIVGLFNALVRRYIVSPDESKPQPPEWFLKELRAVDFTTNTMQSAIDQPEDEDDVSFAFVPYPDKIRGQAAADLPMCSAKATEPAEKMVGYLHAEEENAKPLHVVVQQGGSSSEWFASAYDEVIAAHEAIVSHDEASYASLGPYTLMPTEGHWLSLINDACGDAVLGNFADVDVSRKLLAKAALQSPQIEQLAIAVVEAWDMDTLIGYARQRLAAHYHGDPQQFAADWREHFAEDEEEEEPHTKDDESP